MRTFLAALLVFASLASADSDKKPLIVHEWGTFTSLQDEHGRTIGGVNIDDEPLPEFVHRLGARRAGDTSGIDWLAGKSLYAGEQSVTMRLETPVIYFYPPDNKPMTFDVTATFKGGVISEFYPEGATTLDGKPSNRSPENIPAKTVGGITWKNVMLNAPQTEGVNYPGTGSHVWLAPRAVPKSTPLTIGKEKEQYIFYRGVANLEAPLRVARTANGDAITIQDTRDPNAALQVMRNTGMWLADFRPDGAAAFRVITDQPSSSNSKAKAISATFADNEYSHDNIAKLRAAMKQSLISDGLFADEAEAMLETWKLSYFKSSGQRLFFIVPRSWTDHVLPLTISQPAEVTRVMIGRIELVTPKQRLTINRLIDEQKTLDKVTAEVLRDSLGRFASSLVNDEHRVRKAAAAAAKTARLAKPGASAPGSGG